MAYSTIEKQRAGAKSYYQRQKEAGLCVKCTQPALEGQILCQNHRDKGRNLVYHREKELA